MKPLSIRWRLTLWYGVVLSAILLGFSVAVFFLMRHHLIALTDAALAEELADFAGDLARCASLDTVPAELGLRYATHEGYEFQVSTASGAVLFRSSGLDSAGLPIQRVVAPTRAPARASLQLPRLGHARLAWNVAHGPAGPLEIEAAVSLAPTDRALEQLTTALFLTGPLVVAGALGGGYLLARKALAPVDRLVAMAQEITSTRLDRRLDVANPGDELGRLASTLNDMIARLERSFDEIRRFTADAAHELRTPLASMRTEIEVALRSARSAERDDRILESLLEEIERLTRLVAQLLYLCREDAGLPAKQRLPVRLDELVRDVANHLQVLAREKGLTLEVAGLPAMVVHGDADRLRQLFWNVLDNAVTYTPSGGVISVWGDQAGNRAHVVVADSGIGIPAPHLSRVFDRFYRVDPARSEGKGGTGLGLAICRAIAEAHGGSVAIESKAGNGCALTVDLPIALSDHSDQARPLLYSIQNV
jgi:two-component system, OmpR family, heavy metal sensor histidine kinase CusS